MLLGFLGYAMKNAISDYKQTLKKKNLMELISLILLCPSTIFLGKELCICTCGCFAIVLSRTCLKICFNNMFLFLFSKLF